MELFNRTLGADSLTERYPVLVIAGIYAALALGILNLVYGTSTPPLY